MSNEHYDIVIIGAGAGGATLARHLAPSGKKILILERGPWLPREKRNWNVKEVAVKGYYQTKEVWLDKDNNPVRSNAHYNVGGNTKFWGAALFRFRERDFEKVIHPDGISPEWPLKYKDFEPYYTKVEKMYDCHGLRGEDPTAPPISKDYPFPPISHDPPIQELVDQLKAKDLHPFHLPTAIRMNEDRRFLSECIRCETCDGFPCLVGGKADAEWNGARPALKYPNVTLITEAKVLRLLTSPSGREVTEIETEIDGSIKIIKGDIVVVSCGAINSAALLLRSANDKHPNGLANSSDQVGRNYMYHLLGAMVAVSSKPNPTVFEKTVGLNDFYWGEEDYPYPMGNIQSTGQILPEMLEDMFKEPLPGWTFEQMYAHSTDWWFMTEDLPDPNNRVTWEKNTIKISYTENNRASFDRLQMRWIEILRSLEMCDEFLQTNLYRSFKVGIQGVAHQCGTCRFGTDPKTSVLDLNCRTHDVDNLYVVDSSFYPSSAALNPTHTLLANALRVGDHLLERMKY
ncbi:MAG: GMC family oxidoreductase [Iphinoe sp. HA4291-MV1]|jgi:choline dehydrogenase-like flavoprotein|nr:GMC family oxidoreductase [Iphinoe sp. HA4291-MV1]